MAFNNSNSLIKYNTPQQITKKTTTKGNRIEIAEKTTTNTTTNTNTNNNNNNTSGVEDILNAILPPREWTHDNHLWIQYVSATPATKSDIQALQQQLEQKLQIRQARETGICPIREELYGQTLDEIIRQVTINCAERGMLMVRVRDEARTTIAAYQTLYESAVAFGMRKALTAEQKKRELEEKIKNIEAEKNDSEKALKEWKTKCEQIERKEAERKAEEGRKHKEEMETMKKQNQHLKKELENMLSVPSTA